MRGGKVDRSHGAIRDALRGAGWLVFDTHALGGWVDLVAYHPAAGVRLVEAKVKGGRPTASQTALQAAGWPIVVLTDERSALEWSARQTCL